MTERALFRQVADHAADSIRAGAVERSLDAILTAAASAGFAHRVEA